MRMRSSSWTKSGTFFASQTFKTPALGTETTRKGLRLVLSTGPLPPSVYLGDTDVIHVIKWTRPSPSIFAYCKRSETGRWEGLGTRLHNVCIDMRVCLSNINQYALSSFLPLRKECSWTIFLPLWKECSRTVFHPLRKECTCSWTLCRM